MILFHAVTVVRDFEYIHQTGVALADRSNPSRLIRVGDERSLIPEEPNEYTGHTLNCVCGCSHVVEDDGRIKLCYGANDRCQCVAETSEAELLEVALQR